MGHAYWDRNVPPRFLLAFCSFLYSSLDVEEVSSSSSGDTDKDKMSDAHLATLAASFLGISCHVTDKPRKLLNMDIR